MWLVVGLGNPGPEYAGNRHNVGFMVVDALASRWRADSFRSKWSSQYAQAAVGAERVVLQKPMQYMNLSGQAAAAAARFYQIPPEQVLVIHDELDLEFGTLRLKKDGGAAGHNGLRSLIACLGSPEFLRLRFGVGKPARGPGADHVLSDFSKHERSQLDDLLILACDMAEATVREGLTAAMNRHHARPKPPKKED